jgi:hypothetical protein
MNNFEEGGTLNNNQSLLQKRRLKIDGLERSQDFMVAAWHARSKHNTCCEVKDVRPPSGAGGVVAYKIQVLKAHFWFGLDDDNKMTQLVQ